MSKGRDIAVSKKFKIPSNHKKTQFNFFSFDEKEINENNSVLCKSHIELFSNREIVIEGCRGVAEYRDDYIKLRLQKGSVTICGNEFCIVSFENGSVVIRGNISSLEFCV